MTNVQIKVNTFNRLKKIRDGVVYDSITAVIDELLQNCQRSFIVSKTGNHSTIVVTIDDDALSIMDNGDGCADPQDIFEFEKTGWEISDAFGQGGSESVFQIADEIFIRSRAWEAYVNVLDIFETGNLEVKISQADEYFEGYEVKLVGKTIKENLEKLGSYIKNMLQFFPCDSFINDEYIDKLDLHEFKSPLKRQFDNNFYYATIGTQTGYKDSAVYYEKRLVCNLWLPGIFAIIELKRDAVTLKAPDRKSIIKDDKNVKFLEQLKADRKAVYIELIENASESDFDAYEWGIEQNLEVEDYADYLPYYDSLAYERDRVKTVNVQPANEGFYVTTNTPHTVLADLELRRRFKSELGHKLVNIVWCEFFEKEKYQEFINKLESRGIRVLYAKTRLYSKAFRHWGIPCISEINEDSSAGFIIKNPASLKTLDKLTKKEEVFLQLLSQIENQFGIQDVFEIADVTEHIYIKDNDKIIVDVVVDAPTAVVRERRKIFLDRKEMKLSRIGFSDTKTGVAKFELTAMLVNVYTIADTLAQLVFGTVEETAEHGLKVSKLVKEIVLRFVK